MNCRIAAARGVVNHSAHPINPCPHRYGTHLTLPTRCETTEKEHLTMSA